jgi:hypothetical protein
VRLPLPCSFVVIAVFCQSSLAQDAPEYTANNIPNPAYLFLALQTHMPTKQGNVPHLQPQEETVPNAQPKTKLDPDQMQREGRELLELSQSLQADIESLNHGLHPKDTIEKLKRIQKLAKHIRGEIAP